MKLQIEDYQDEYSFDFTETCWFLKSGKSNINFQKHVNNIIIFPK